MAATQGYEYVSMCMEAESGMAKALRAFKYTIEMWLEQTTAESKRLDGCHYRLLPCVDIYLPKLVWIQDKGEEESFYTVRYEHDNAEVALNNAATNAFKKHIPWTTTDLIKACKVAYKISA